MLVWVGIALLGGVGALARFSLDAAVSERLGREFPWGTFAINITGAFILGLLVGAGAHGDSYALEGTAVIGSYTTFSTWLFESQRLAEDGEWQLGLLNILVSLAAGIGAAELGRLIGGAL